MEIRGIPGRAIANAATLIRDEQLKRAGCDDEKEGE